MYNNASYGEQWTRGASVGYSRRGIKKKIVFVHGLDRERRYNNNNENKIRRHDNNKDHK